MILKSQKLWEVLLISKCEFHAVVVLPSILIVLVYGVLDSVDISLPFVLENFRRGGKSSGVLGLALTSQLCDCQEDQMRSFTHFNAKEDTRNQGTTGLQQRLHATITAH